MRFLVAACAAGFLTLSACGTDSGDTVDAAAVVAPAPETVTVTEEPEPAPAPAPETVTVTSEPKPKKTKEPKPAPADEDTFVMPNEIGKILQDAQDDMQAVTGNFLFYTRSEDATGDGRFQVLDRGWQVCFQSPDPGETFDYDTDVVFYVVRDSENCPG